MKKKKLTTVENFITCSTFRESQVYCDSLAGSRYLSFSPPIARRENERGESELAKQVNRKEA